MSTAGSYTKLSSKGQVTLPKGIRTAAHLEEGDPLKVELTDEGILLRPQKLVDAAQAWFFTSAWQEGEAAASADIAAGRVTRFMNDDDLLASLDD